MTKKQQMAGLVLAAAAVLASPAAQAQTPAPAPSAARANVFQQAYGAWKLICAPLKTGGEMCEIQQAAMNDKQQQVAGFALIRRGNDLAMRVDLPIGVYLRKNPMLQVDKGASTDGLSYLRCTPRLCIARMTIAPAFLDAMRKGSEMTVTFNSNERTTLSAKVSLNGYADAEKALVARK